MAGDIQEPLYCRDKNKLRLYQKSPLSYPDSHRDDPVSKNNVWLLIDSETSSERHSVVKRIWIPPPS